MQQKHFYKLLWNKKVLNDISDNNDQKATGRSLLSTMMTLETWIRIILWDQVLQRFQMTTASFQFSDQDLNTFLTTLEYSTLWSLRGIFKICSLLLQTEQKAKDPIDCEYYQEQTLTKHKRNREYDDFSGSCTLDPLAESETPSHNLKAKHFLSLLIACSPPCQNARKIIKSWMIYLDSFVSYSRLHLKRW